VCPCSPRCGKSIVFWLLHQIHIVFQHLLFAPLSLRGCRRVPLENLRLNNGGLLMLKQSPRLFLWYGYSCASFGGQAFLLLSLNKQDMWGFHFNVEVLVGCNHNFLLQAAQNPVSLSICGLDIDGCLMGSDFRKCSRAEAVPPLTTIWLSVNRCW
jgi:hypothetical protein